jgi:hypothetical protein
MRKSSFPISLTMSSRRCQVCQVSRQNRNVPFPPSRNVLLTPFNPEGSKGHLVCDVPACQAHRRLTGPCARRSDLTADTDPVVHGGSNTLLAAEVPLRRSDRGVPEQVMDTGRGCVTASPRLGGPDSGGRRAGLRFWRAVHEETPAIRRNVVANPSAADGGGKRLNASFSFQ